MENNSGAKDAQKLKKPLKFIIEGEDFETFDQYKTGAELKELKGIPLDTELYLSIAKPYSDELIENDKSVNLARPEIEKFFVKESYKFTFNEIKLTSYKKMVSGKEIFSIAGIEHPNCFVLYQKLKGHDFEKISLDEIVDLSMPGIENFITKDSEIFVYTLDGEHEMTDKKVLTAREILEFGAVNVEKFYLIQSYKDGSEKNYAYSYDEKIEMNCSGLVFITKEWLDIADVEEYGKKCELIPPARSFRIKIDKNYHIVKGKNITKAEIITLEGKPEVIYDAYKILNNNPKPVKILDDETVDLTEKCLVRFVLQPKEQQDGKGNRQNFVLPEEDVETLEKLSLQWETLLLPSMWLIIYNYPIPDGYNVKNVDIALTITSSYPATEIDMAYFFPPLVKNNGRSINAIQNQHIDGKIFQRWSRHRKPGDWKPGVDNLATHLSLVDNWLLNDLKR
ncbi:MAG: multiubiquitin domain-containing protein [Flavobacterium nitrogenifigens]|uniref:multiubiquitin domain-containing protein n=1 Tax=Flavobacterium nitrogenifigens TaxID=1617283 RepID=UPI0028086D3D|nr:multiubiquitin domain-containing protein [Flavobacterium nitrogenifigens]MDQ8011384.1 multiubiquitin domain-containing protein [Flavobacterium nitrogenifigens]